MSAGHGRAGRTGRAVISMSELQRNGASEVYRWRLGGYHGEWPLGSRNLHLRGREWSVVEGILSRLLMMIRRPVERHLRERSQRLLECKTLVVALALSLGLDAVVASGFAFVALDAALPARCCGRQSS